MNKLLRPLVGFVVALLAAAAGPVFAALTDLSPTPLASTTSAQVKPNIMLLMDTSVSMAWGHMPDEVETLTGIGNVGYKSAQCNVLYYNPNQTYILPKKSDGTLFPVPSFTAAPYAGFASFYANADMTDRSVTNLATEFQAYDYKTVRYTNGTTTFGDTRQPAYYYVYTGSQTLSYKAAPCTDTDIGVTKAATGGGQWTRVDVFASTAADRANFAVWYSFYRTRISLIKSAASLAFTPLTDTFRVGFITVFPKISASDTSINPDNYLRINDFNAQQRNDWFAKLFSQSPRGSSPAREGLARVGRMYAGKHDGINRGMADDPVQYSCQQNFTIMTTDGYWNTQDESPSGGPVRIDGTTLVGQQDGTLVSTAVDPNSLTPRPIWDGTIDGTAIVENYTNAYRYAACGAYAYRSTLQSLQSTVQNLQTTTQTRLSTRQNLQSTNQNLQSTTQTVQSTTQTRVSTRQNLQNTTQRLRSTNQNLQSTSQSVSTASQVTQTQTVMRQSTAQNLQSTAQTTQSTSQPTSSTSQTLQSTNQNRQSTSQALQSTSQTTRSTSQLNASTQQVRQSTSQATITTVQVQRATSQTSSCDAQTESCTYVAPGTCTSSRYTSCSTTATGPTLVASCTPQTAAANNNYVQVSCTSNSTGPTGTGSCTPAAASAGNSYTTTTCNTATTGPTPVASCTPQTASAGNGYTATTCSTSTTQPTPVASCTPSGATSSNNYTQTTCSTATTGPTAVASCSPSGPTAGNSYTTTTCGTAATSNVPVASCTPSSPNAANNFTTTTCPAPIVTTNVPVASCTANAANAANSYTATTCPAPVVTTNVPVASCTPASASSSNNFVSTTCATSTTGPTVVASCSPVAASSSNNYTATTCANNTTSNVGVSSCSASGANVSNSYTTTTCGTNNTSNAPVASCAPASANASNAFTTTTCGTNNTSNVAVASCAPATASAGNNWTTTTCSSDVTGPTVVASCTVVAPTAGNGFQRTACGSNAVDTPSGNCVASGPTAANNYTTTSCNNRTTNNVPVASCTPSGPTSSNNWTTTTCPSPVTTTNVPVANCTAAAASSGNSWTTTTCPTPVTTTNVPVATCTAAGASSGNNFTQTTCPSAVTTGPTAAASCTPAAASSSNNYVQTSCPANNTTNVPVSSCTASGPSSANGYTTTTCPSPITTSNVPVATCTPATASSSNSWRTTTCPSPATTANVPVASCTAATASSANSWTTTTCPAAVTSGPTGVASCTPVAASSSNNFVETTCSPNNTSSVPVASCTAAGPSSANGFVTTSCAANNVDNVPVATCTTATATAGNNYTATTCASATTGPTLVTSSSCVDAAAASSNTYTATSCAGAQGKQLQYSQTHTVSRQSFSGGRPVSAAVVTTDPPTGPFTLGQCFAPGGTPGSPGTEPQPPVAPNPEPLPPRPAGCTAWPCTTTETAGAGSINALADVAQYYYATDLRPATDWSTSISANNVPAVGSGPEDDRVQWQHMTTFTLGLGVSGNLNYRPDYLSAATGDFASIRSGLATTNPDGTTTASNWPLWPDPSVNYTDFNNWNNPKSIDDFWHTAINGRGKYFSAGNPTSVIAGLSGALVGVQARLSSGAAAGISTAQPVVGGDNRVYVGLYTTSEWTGDVQARDTDLVTGLPSTQFWSAQALLNAKTGAACDDRNIYLLRAGGSLINFSAGSIARCDGTIDTSAGLDAGELGNFAAANVQLLSQWPSMSSAQQTAAPGANLVNFLRGQRGKEEFSAGDVTKLYRTRRHVLGDVAGSQPVVVKAPSFGYADAGYAQFAIDNASRTPMVYVGANDGMLHAFYAGTSSNDPLGGQEAWAVIPSTVLPRLYRLADDNYRNIHQFSVDGTPVVADARGPNGWRTVLVGGLNNGGKGYYALDVSDPTTPRALWEFKGGGTCHADSEVGYAGDCYLGYSYGKPVVTKLANGAWVVMFTSGYNNLGGGNGDGQGYLYVVDAFNGTLISRTSTNAGSASTPSGLAQINTYVENGAVDNTALRVYGGDLLGNVWRFELNGTPTVTRLGTAKAANGTAQPITVRPELAELNGKPMVLVGTGRLLGPSDIGDRSLQSIYGIVDPLAGSPVYSDLRAALAPLAMTVSTDGLSRTIACTGSATACGSANGWVADFPPGPGSSPTGERVNVDMKLASSTLVIGSNIPQSDACSTGGSSWITSLNFASGLAVTSGGTAIVSSVVSSDSLLTGFSVMQLPSGDVRAVGELAGRTSQTTSAGTTGTDPPCTGQAGEVACKVPTNKTPPPTKRISWREVLQ